MNNNAPHVKSPLRSHLHHLWVLCTIDAVCVAFAFLLAYLLHSDFLLFAEEPIYYVQYFRYGPVIVAVRILLFYFMGHYRGVSAYAGIRDIVYVGLIILLGTLLISAGNVSLEFLPSSGELSLGGHLLRIPWGVVLLEGLLTFLIIGSIRIWPRIYLIYFSGTKSGEMRIVVIGANNDGINAARALAEDPRYLYQTVAFIDRDPALTGRSIGGIRVMGDLNALRDVVQQTQANMILIALPDASPRELREIIRECERARLRFQRVPNIGEVVSGRVTVNELRPVEVEDLLGRPPVKLEMPEERNYIRGECVLVTGAGGSIGAELCRQALRYQPQKLIILGRGENSVFEIATELDAHERRDLELVIGDVYDQAKLEKVFDAQRPTIIFHAAAHKHVPLMELHPDEAARNNVLATRSLAQLADRRGVKQFIFISTDKAVRPTNVMGASKRMTEMAILQIDRHSPTAFNVVRFGNVLGSRGSVIPLIKRQIRRGGPVTITHKDVTRYFMTIPEAVDLVIQAGSLGRKGQLFLLDMGQPVKIDDLARNIITLSGLEPGVDIEIKYIGLRPGEKLIEELLTAGEGVTKTELGKLFVVEPEALDEAFILKQLAALETAAAAKDTEAIKTIFRETVPDYKPQSA